MSFLILHSLYYLLLYSSRRHHFSCPPSLLTKFLHVKLQLLSFFSFFSFFLRFDMVVVHVQLQLQLLLLFSSVALSLRIMIALARNNIAPVFHFSLSFVEFIHLLSEFSLSFYSILHSFSFSLSPFHSISLEWSKLICHILKSHRHFLRRVLYEFCWHMFQLLLSSPPPFWAVGEGTRKGCTSLLKQCSLLEIIFLQSFLWSFFCSLFLFSRSSATTWLMSSSDDRHLCV